MWPAPANNTAHSFLYGSMLTLICQSSSKPRRSTPDCNAAVHCVAYLCVRDRGRYRIVLAIEFGPLIFWQGLPNGLDVLKTILEHSVFCVQAGNGNGHEQD